MKKDEFRTRVTKETWTMLLACQRHLDEKVSGGAKVPPMCICCPSTSGTQIYALWEGGEDRRWTDKKPTDWKWTHHTLRALNARMEEEAKVLVEEHEVRQLAAQEALHMTRMLEARDELERRVYETEVHVTIRRTLVQTTPTQHAVWDRDELLQILRLYGPLDIDTALEYCPPISGSEPSQVRLRACFKVWLYNLATGMNAAIIIDEFEKLVINPAFKSRKKGK